MRKEIDLEEHEPKQITSSFHQALIWLQEICVLFVGFLLFVFKIEKLTSGKLRVGALTAWRDSGRSGTTCAGCSGEISSPLSGSPLSQPRTLSPPPGGYFVRVSSGRTLWLRGTAALSTIPGCTSQHYFQSALQPFVTAGIICHMDLGTDSQTCQKCHHPLVLSIRRKTRKRRIA